MQTPDRVPIAYFLTFVTYGSWLPGDDRGFAGHHRHDAHVQLRDPVPELRRASRESLKAPEVCLGEPARMVVLSSVRSSAVFREWELYAAHVRTQHVHVVVGSPQSAGYVLRDLKAYATRALRQAGLTGPESPVWARHGSTLHIWDIEGLERVVHYTLYEQGDPMAYHDGRDQES